MGKAVLKKTKVQIGLATLILMVVSRYVPGVEEMTYQILWLGLSIIGAHFGTDVAAQFAKKKPE